jgi:hypothetical protein
MNHEFVAIARDPRIIPGVHRYCDEWCRYCPVTQRCLGFRATEAYRKAEGRTPLEPTFTSLDEAARFTRELWAAEGVRTDELDAPMSHPPADSGIGTADALAERAWEYAEGVTRAMFPVVVRFLSSEAAEPASGGPTPEETVAWHHLRIYMKVFRALVARETHRDSADSQDARGAAKLALVSIDRSLEALERLRGSVDVEAHAQLCAILGELRDGLEARVPGARAFIRIGIDEPAGAGG